MLNCGHVSTYRMIASEAGTIAIKLAYVRSIFVTISALIPLDSNALHTSSQSQLLTNEEQKLDRFHLHLA